MRDLRAAVLAALLVACRALPDEPTAIAYDREACAHCHMLIGDPRYAAQLVTTGGEILDFDDPGCALAYLAASHPAVHRLWFRDAHADRWVAASEVRFATGGETPMGSGLGAVAGAMPGTLSLDQAAARVAQRVP